MALTAEQKALLKSLGLPTNFNNLTYDDRLAIDEAISMELEENGIGEDGTGPSAHGRLCESILEALDS